MPPLRLFLYGAPTQRKFASGCRRDYRAAQLPLPFAEIDNMILIQYSLPGAWRASNHIGSIWLADARRGGDAKHTIALHMAHKKIMDESRSGARPC